MGYASVTGGDASPRYRVLFPLAAGGMGTVSLAVQRGAGGFSRLIAIKRAHAHLVSESALRKSLVEEARIAAAIRHANVVAVLDVEEQGGEVTLVMEYVEGASLSELLASPRPLSLALAGRIVLDVARGLHAAHETADLAGHPLGIVHRDVSPQNILVGVDGIARISDFGVAKASRGANRTASDPGTVRGKRAYCAPEYLETGRSDKRLDVFSLGVVAREAFAGRRDPEPHEAGSVDGSVADQGRLPSAIHSSLPPGLYSVLQRAVVTDPEARFQTVHEFSEALQQVLSHHGLLLGADEVSRHVLAAFGPALAERRRVLRSLLASAHADVPSGRLPDELTLDFASPPHESGRAARAPANPQPTSSSLPRESAAPRRSRSALVVSAGLLVTGAMGGVLLSPSFERAPAGRTALAPSRPPLVTAAPLLPSVASVPPPFARAESSPSAASPATPPSPSVPSRAVARRTAPRASSSSDRAPPNPYRLGRDAGELSARPD